MENRALNSKIKMLHQAFKLILDDNTIDQKQVIENQIKKDCENIMMCVGAVSVMSHQSIIKMVRMQSHLRYMPEHRFFQAFVRAEEDLKL